MDFYTQDDAFGYGPRRRNTASPYQQQDYYGAESNQVDNPFENVDPVTPNPVQTFAPPDQQEDPAPAPETPAGPDYGTLGQYVGVTGGLYDKLHDLTYKSPKYQILRVMSHFDPREGITPELLAALNTLGIGTFSKLGRQGLRVSGNVHKDFKDTLSTQDIIGNFDAHDDSTVWRGWGAGSNVAAPKAKKTAAAPSMTGTPSYSSGYASGGGSAASAATPTPTIAATATGTGESDYGPPPGISDELWNMLLSRAQQGTDVTGNDPAIKAQVDAFSAQQDRARRNFLGDVAERGSPYGTGAMLGQERMAFERAGQATGAMEAQLIGREIQARRDEIQHALDSMGDLLTAQQRNALELELAKMDNALEQQKINNQNAQFYAGLSQADRHFLDQLAQEGRFKEMDEAFRYMQAAQQNDQFYSSLDQNQNQFLDDLGFRSTQERNYWDWVNRGNRP